MTWLRWAVFAGLGGVWLALGLVAASGCSSSSSPAAPSKGEGDASVEAATGMGGGDAAAEGGRDGGVSLTWSTIIYSPAFFSGPTGDGGASGDAGAQSGGDGGEGGAPPVPGAEICVVPQGAIPASTSTDATGNCATTAADGTFVLASVPIRTNLVLTVKKSGYIPGLLSITTASTPMDGRGDPIPMFPVSYETYPPHAATQDWVNKGLITAFALGPGGGLNFAGEPGSVLAISPMSGSGPVYVDQNGFDVASATSMIANHANLYNVDPGTYTISISDSADDCEPISVFFAGYGFPLVTPLHALEVVVSPGYWSGIVGFLCTTKSALVDAGS